MTRDIAEEMLQLADKINAGTIDAGPDWPVRVLELREWAVQVDFDTKCYTKTVNSPSGPVILRFDDDGIFFTQPGEEPIRLSTWEQYEASLSSLIMNREANILGTKFRVDK